MVALRRECVALRTANKPVKKPIKMSPTQERLKELHQQLLAQRKLVQASSGEERLKLKVNSLERKFRLVTHACRSKR